jgi:cytochrome b6-f complex iron-sulfur subunit
MNQESKTEESNKSSILDNWLEKMESRRGFFKRLGWGGVVIFLLGNIIASIRFSYPRILFEPPSRFKVGKPSEYPFNMVNTGYKDKHGIWIVRNVPI